MAEYKERMYHVRPDGTWKRCNAQSPETCKYKQYFHSSNLKEVQNYIDEMLEKELTEERKHIEEIITKNLTRFEKDDSFEIDELYQNNKGELLSYSPYQANEKTDLQVPDDVRYQYSNLSRAIHNIRNSKRGLIEQEINKIIPENTLLFTFEWYNILQTQSYKQMKDYCMRNHFKIPSKEDYNRLQNLINKWKEESKDSHYRMNKAQKRKMKKLHKETGLKKERDEAEKLRVLSVVKQRKEDILKIARERGVRLSDEWKVSECIEAFDRSVALKYPNGIERMSIELRCLGLKEKDFFDVPLDVLNYFKNNY